MHGRVVEHRPNRRFQWRQGHRPLQRLTLFRAGYQNMNIHRPAQHRRRHHAAVAEHVRRAREAARPAADGSGRAAGLLAQEAREVLRHRGVGCVREPQLLKADAPLPRNANGKLMKRLLRELTAQGS